MTCRLAIVGYEVLLPNRYYRVGRDTVYGPRVREHDSDEWKLRYLAGERRGREPALSLAKIQGELSIACADLAPLPMVKELQGLFKAAGTAGEIEIYPEVPHGFGFPESSVYDKAVTERHWERLFSLSGQRLPGREPHL